MFEPEIVKPEELKDVDAEILLLLAPDSLYDEMKGVIGSLKNAVGAIFPGVLYDGRIYNDRVVAVRFDEKLKVFRGRVPDIGNGTLLTLVDGFYEDAENMLEKAYFKLGNTVTYIGGGAGSLDRRIDCLLLNNEMFSDDVLFVHLPLTCNLAVRHGWRETQFRFIANKTRGRRIEEMNWMPAFEVYTSTLREMGVDVEGNEFFDVAKNYPLGITKVRGEDVVRDPLFADGDSIVCAGKVPQNYILKLMEGDKRELINAARACAKDVDGNIAFDCISRVLYLGEDFKKEAKHLKGMFGSLTIGEVACKKGFIEFHNKTVVVGELHG